MLILADENMPLAAELFGRHGQVRLLPGRGLTAEAVREADALLVRSVTRVGPELLAGSGVRFVGSATIGTDHLDRAWLDSQGIAWANAPGCNAEAVAEYVLASLLVLGEREGFSLRERRIGIVGAGHVGTALARKLDALGVAHVLNDLPLQAAGDPRAFVSLDAALACDVLSLHVPLSRHGDHPSFHLMNDQRLARLQPDTILLNASRGAVIDNRALRERLASGARLSAVLDVWEGEPAIDAALAARVALATPHIAGYSLDGKLRGSLMIYQAFCQHFGLEPVAPERVQPELPAPEPMTITRLDDAALRRLVWTCYDPRRDDAALRASLVEPEPAVAFDRLRKHYPVRREFSALRVEAPESVRTQLLALGFSPRD